MALRPHTLINRVDCACQMIQVKGSSKEERAARNAGAEDSIQKLHKVLELCEELGVATQPALLGQLLLVPLAAWHHQVGLFVFLIYVSIKFRNVIFVLFYIFMLCIIIFSL